MKLTDVIQILKTAPRIGGPVDEPEGTRSIQISETLVNLMIAALEGQQK